jgi:RNA polymerase sigma-70 factor (ECF subfamily)
MIEAKELKLTSDFHLDEYKAILLPFAYNITGDFMAAEDIVQEILTNFLLNPKDTIASPKHYLIRSVINRSINEKKLLRNRMEDYRGRWLPSPVLTEEGIYKGADRDKVLHYSLLVLLERLTAKERAVFILKETFDFEHEEIADILNIKKDHSRQLLKRAKEKIGPAVGRSQQPSTGNEEFLKQLIEAISTSDVTRTKMLLSADVQCVSDGGTKMKAARNMLTGQERVSKFLKAIYGKYHPAGTTSQLVQINFHPAILFKVDNRIFRCIIFEIEEGTIQKIFIIVNPDKLQKLQF